MRRAIASLIVVLYPLGCAAAAAGPPDARVPENEARATAEVDVELPRNQGCEEAFDLAIYKNRAIELVEWDEKSDQCGKRHIRIRYLSNRMDKDAALRAAREAERGGAR